MILVYHSTKRGMVKTEITPQDKLPRSVLWIDLVEPTPEEERYIANNLDIDTPNREELDKLEVVSPYYKEDNAYFMTVTILYKQEADSPRSMPITFIITPKCLVTLRHARPRTFSNFASRALRKSDLYSSPELILEGLVEALVHRIGDVLEKTGNELDELLLKVFDRKQDAVKSSTKANTSEYYDDIIKQIGRYGNFISKNRESLVSISRMLIFFGQITQEKPADGKATNSRKGYAMQFRNISREVHSLSEYANFLSQRNNFLLDATLGMLNVEQNMIIKVFTVAAAVFMPPTLIASIYGMNFKAMPELEWLLGYPFALMIMIISALIPYLFFRKKGWI